MEISQSALAVTYWLHLLATVAWIGGLAALALLVLPAASSSLPSENYAALLGAIQRRLDPLGWFCIMLLAGTGMFQMSANPNYQGFLAVQNRWAFAILLKHIAFFVMTAVSAYLTWGVLPSLRRAVMRRMRVASASPDAAETTLLRREQFLLRLNLILALLVLALTAAARAAS